MKTAAELANAILNWQNVQRGEVEEVEPWAQPSLAGLIVMHRDAVLEEAALAAMSAARGMGVIGPLGYAGGAHAAEAIRALKAKP